MLAGFGVNYHTMRDQLNTPKLAKTVRDKILADGRACVPALLDVLADESQWGADEDGEGRAAIHAATLLGALKATTAIAPMLDALDELEMDSELAVALVDALTCMGRAVVEPVLKRNRDSEDLETQVCFIEILARCGVQDTRIFDLLCRELTTDVTLGAVLLAKYGDPEGIAHLSQALDAIRLQPGDSNGPRALEVLEVSAAIEDLHGELTARQQEKRELARAIQAALPPDDGDLAKELAEPVLDAASKTPPEPLRFKKREAPAEHVHGPNCNHGPQTPLRRVREKVGPNDPCHCGSNKKYKKCHLFADERNRY